MQDQHGTTQNGTARYFNTSYTRVSRIRHASIVSAAWVPTAVATLRTRGADTRLVHRRRCRHHQQNCGTSSIATTTTTTTTTTITNDNNTHNAPLKTTARSPQTLPPCPSSTAAFQRRRRRCREWPLRQLRWHHRPHSPRRRRPRHSRRRLSCSWTGLCQREAITRQTETEREIEIERQETEAEIETETEKDRAGARHQFSKTRQEFSTDSSIRTLQRGTTDCTQHPAGKTQNNCRSTVGGEAPPHQPPPETTFVPRYTAVGGTPADGVLDIYMTSCFD